MKTGVLVVLLLPGLCALSPPVCDNIYPNTDMKKTPFKTLRDVQTVEACRRECEENSHCDFFTYLDSNWPEVSRKNYCYLKSGTPTEVKPNPGVSAGHSSAGCMKTACKVNYENTEMKKAPLRTLSIIQTVEECHKKCEENLQCDFFTYLDSNWPVVDRRNFCYLKSGTPTEVNTYPGVTSGYSSRSCKPTVCDNIYPNTEMKKTPFKSLSDIQSVEECRKKCEENSLCSFFTYLDSNWPEVSRKNSCFLKYGRPTELKPNTGVTSGYSSKGCTKTACKDHFLNTEMKKPAFKTLSDVQTVEECHEKCEETSECDFFTYLDSNWPIFSRRNFCYLKSGLPLEVKTYPGVTSGYSSRSCKPTVCDNIYPNTEMTKTPFKTLRDIQSVEDCHEKCEDNSGCDFFTFLDSDWPEVSRRNQCYLKTGLPREVKPYTGISAGYSSRGCKRTACKDHYLNTEMKKHAFRTLSDVQTVEECHEKCEENSKCSFFTYLDSNWPIFSRRNYCYLKSGTPLEIKTFSGITAGYSSRGCK